MATFDDDPAVAQPRPMRFACPLRSLLYQVHRRLGVPVAYTPLHCQLLSLRNNFTTSPWPRFTHGLYQIPLVPSRRYLTLYRPHTTFLSSSAPAKSRSSSLKVRLVGCGPSSSKFIHRLSSRKLMIPQSGRSPS